MERREEPLRSKASPCFDPCLAVCRATMFRGARAMKKYLGRGVYPFCARRLLNTVYWLQDRQRGQDRDVLCM
jgi:hypothetical protein